MAIYRTNEIRIDLNELVSIRSSFLGEEMSQEDVEELSSDLKDRLTWDTLYGMVDSAILEYLDKPDPNKPHYGEIAGDEPAKTFEQQRKNAAQFEMVKLTSYSWEIEVPRRKNK